MPSDIGSIVGEKVTTIMSFDTLKVCLVCFVGLALYTLLIDHRFLPTKVFFTFNSNQLLLYAICCINFKECVQGQRNVENVYRNTVVLTVIIKALVLINKNLYEIEYFQMWLKRIQFS